MSNLSVLREQKMKWVLVVLVVTAVILLLLFAYQPALLAGLEPITGQIAGSCDIHNSTCLSI
jgi:hypothetical protein